MTSPFKRTAEGSRKIRPESSIPQSSIQPLDLSKRGNSQERQAADRQRDSQERQATERDSLLPEGNTPSGDQSEAEDVPYVTKLWTGFKAIFSECSPCLQGGKDTSRESFARATD